MVEDITTEKMRVSASSVISSVADTSATAVRSRAETVGSVVTGRQCSIWSFVIWLSGR